MMNIRDDFDQLTEGPMSPIPVRPFKKIHGNYGGPGNRGGEPVDTLDLACKKHDTGYHYTENHPKRDVLRRKHDRSLIKAAHTVAHDKTHPVLTRIKAMAIKHYFNNKLKKAK